VLQIAQILVVYEAKIIRQIIIKGIAMNVLLCIPSLLAKLNCLNAIIYICPSINRLTPHINQLVIKNTLIYNKIGQI
jgi:hypothetical protein